MKGLTATIAIAAVLGLFAYTNPNMATYEQFLRNSMIQQARREGDTSGAFAALFSGIASGMLVGATTRSDYVFCSFYVTDLGDTHVKALGALNNFFVLKESGLGHAPSGNGNQGGAQ